MPLSFGCLLNALPHHLALLSQTLVIVLFLSPCTENFHSYSTISFQFFFVPPVCFQETVLIVEKNPSKFCISSEELRLRQQFLDEVKNIVKSVKDQLCDPNELIVKSPKLITFDVTMSNKAASSVVNGFNQKNRSSTP